MATASPGDPCTTAFSLLRSSSALPLSPLSSTITARFSETPPESRSVPLPFRFSNFLKSTRGSETTTFDAPSLIMPKSSVASGIWTLRCRSKSLLLKLKRKIASQHGEFCFLTFFFFYLLRVLT